MLTLEKARREPDADRVGRATRRRCPPRVLGVREFLDYDNRRAREYIDWQPFFNAWEMKGRFPDILNNPVSGETGPQAVRRRPGDARQP